MKRPRQPPVEPIRHHVQWGRTGRGAPHLSREELRALLRRIGPALILDPHGHLEGRL